MLAQIQNLTKTYTQGDKPIPVLKQVNLSLKEKEFVILWGPSGSGKSTLLHLLAGLDRPSSGKILIAGQALHTFNPQQLARFRGENLGIVFQFFNLFSSLSVRDNVLMPAMVNQKNITQAQQRCDQLLNQVGLYEKKHRPVYELSGGEKQRVALCRALLNRPKLLLADEPTGSLDSNHAQSILKLFQQLTQDEPTTILMVTHDPHAKTLADRNLAMMDGCLA